MKKLDVNLNHDSYSIYIENGIINNALDYIEKIYNNKKRSEERR